jgi:hypothetical protein
VHFPGITFHTAILKITDAETNGHNPPLSVFRHFMCFVMSIKKLHTPSTVYGIVIMGKQTAS